MSDDQVKVKYEDPIFSCKKCRQKLFNADLLVDEHANPISVPSQHKSSCISAEGNQCSESTVWFINEHNLPDWMDLIINDANWVKGKLTCPKCKSRVGSFDFVSGSKCSCGTSVLPPVHIVRAKVDLKDPRSVAFLRRPSGMEDTAKFYTDFGDELEKHETEESKEFPEKPKTNLPVMNEAECSSAGIAARPSEIGLDTLAGGTSQIKTKKCRKTPKVSETKMVVTETSEKQPLQDVPVEPPEDIICPVCLDIYMSPFVCYPCVHVFCEICLRRIAKNNPQKTLCPLCRQQIGMCLPDHDRSHKVRTLYPTAHKSRQKMLQSLRNSPLPWQTHYRLRQLSNVGRSFLWSDRDQFGGERRRNIWETISTIALLISLQLIAMLAFVVGYQGGKYAIGILEVMEIFAENILDIAFGNFAFLWMPDQLVNNYTL